MSDEKQVGSVDVAQIREKPKARKRICVKPHYKTLPQKLLSDILQYPDVFSETILGFKLYPKQRIALRQMSPNKAHVSFISCNDGGKSLVCVSSLVCWHLAAFPKGKIVATSGSARQLEAQLIPAIQRHKDKFPNYRWLDSGPITTQQGGTFKFFTTNDPGKAEGDHADAGKGTWDNPEIPLLFIVDECKSVPDWLRVAVEDRVKPTRIFLCSSPGFAEGWFFDTHTKDNYYPSYRKVTQSAAECPHIDPEWIRQLRLKWAGNPDVARSVLGEGFMGMVEGAIIDFRLLNDNINFPPAFNQNFDVHAFCDFSWSGQDGDECVLALRRGNRITIEAAFTASTLRDVCDRFCAEYKRLGLESRMISGDDGGGGHLCIDELHDRGWKIHRVNNESAPRDPEHFSNASAEMWFNAAGAIANRTHIWPDDSELRTQLVNRKRKEATKGRLAIESKKEMKSRNVPSPDRADACIGTLSKSGHYSTNGETTFIKPLGIEWQPLVF